MKKLFFLITGLLLSNLLIAQTNTWIAGSGNWGTNGNWSLGTFPATTNTEDIIIDCTCTVTNDIGNLVIDGSMQIAAGSTLNMGASNLEVGKGNNSAWLTNDGTITNSNKISVKGTATGFEQGPWIFSSGSISATDMHIGNNNGGGVFTNLSTGTVNLTAGIHMDGTLCNEGSMIMGGTLKIHGSQIKCCGYIETPLLDIDDNGGRPGTLECTNICTGGGGDPVIDIDGTIYSDLKDAFDNAPASDVDIDEENTFIRSCLEVEVWLEGHNHRSCGQEALSADSGHRTVSMGNDRM